MAEKQSSGIITYRNNNAIVMPPGPLSFSNLLKPDTPTAFEGAPRFDMTTHWNETAQARFGQLVEEHVLKPGWETFLADLNKSIEEQRKKGGKVRSIPKEGFIRPDPMEWLADHMRAPSERSKVQLPSIKFANEAEYRDRKTGEIRQKTMKAFDGQGNLLDLKKLRMGMESIVQPIVLGGIFISPILKQPSFSFKLQGLRVLQLVQYGGGGAVVGEVSEEDVAMLGDNFQATDLSAYMGTSEPDNSVQRHNDTSPGGAADYGDDDEVPF